VRGSRLASHKEMNMDDALNTTDQMLRGFAASLPRLLLAVVLGLLFYFIGQLVRSGMARASNGDPSHRTLNLALGRIAHGTIAVVGILIAVTAAFPGFTPASLVSALGIGGIAIGFAFKDIFENFLAGILILITRPFRIGDQIIYDKYEGTVEDIHIRATWLKTYDGRRVVIPNSDVFTHAVTVNTAFDNRRLEDVFKIRDGSDAEEAKLIIATLLNETEGVLPDPKADVVVTAFDDTSVNLKARWWSKSRIGDVLIAQDHVLSAVRKSLADARITLSSAAPQLVVQQPSNATSKLDAPGPVKPRASDSAEKGSQDDT
jgi:small-conductance mechanosensitive channel